MNVEEVVSFLTHLGVPESSIMVDASRGWVRSSCPFAPWLHSSGEDSKPSFGLSVSDDDVLSDNKVSVGYCFSCMSDVGARTAPFLVQLMWKLSQQYPRIAARIAAGSGEDYETLVSGNFRNNFDSELDTSEMLQGSASLNKALSIFPRMHDSTNPEFRNTVENYLEFRGISRPIQRLYDVRYSTHDGIIGFPLTTENGEVCHLRIRRPYTKYIRTLSPYYFMNMPNQGFEDIYFPRIIETGAFFGLHTIVKGLPIYVVEGEIDAMKWYSLGFPNVIASTTTSVCASQFSRLFSLSNRVIFGFDSDLAGNFITGKAAKNAAKADCSVYVIDWSVAGVKDAGALTDKDQVQQIKKAIKPLTMI